MSDHTDEHIEDEESRALAAEFAAAAEAAEAEIADAEDEALDEAGTEEGGRAPASEGRSGGQGGRGQGGRQGFRIPEPLYRAKVRHSNETFFASWDKGEPALLPAGTKAVATTRYGKDLVELQGVVKAPSRISQDELLKLERLATEDDLAKAAANAEKEAKAFEACRQRIETRRLPMKLVSAHYLLEESKILFFFSAESRVDFRELVKDLVSVFKTRIELRQIGVRDEARVTGGCGVCGRVLCCHGVSDKLTPVSIKMAKDQNLSLNSMKISGPCGRLLCCLAYEYGFYRDARRELPGEGARFTWDGTLFRVIEVNCLGGSVKVAGEDGRVLVMPASRFVHTEGKWQVKPEQD